MSGLIGRKIGMTSIFDENEYSCTVIEAGPCVVTQVRTIGVDLNEALQLGDDKNEKHSNKKVNFRSL
jgi:large subunit ribosomal protein L3